MKKWMLQILVVAGLIVLAVVLQRRDQLPEAPEDTVSQFFDAASRADDRTYLRLTTGELRKSLEHSRSQLGTERFQDDLRRTAAGIKGLAYTRSDGQTSSDAVTLDVEIIFVDRNEQQKMLLENRGNGWAIAAITAAEMVKPPIPYGTPVFEETEAQVTNDERPMTNDQ